MPRTRNIGQQSDAILKRFEVVIDSTQFHKTIVLVAARTKKEAKEKALAWGCEEILDTYQNDQEDEVTFVEEICPSRE